MAFQPRNRTKSVQTLGRRTAPFFPLQISCTFDSLFELLVLEQHYVAGEHHQTSGRVLVLERREVLCATIDQ